MAKFKVLRNDRCAGGNQPPISSVVERVHQDFGCSADDTESTGIRHIAVKTTDNGPFFTMPLEDLQEIFGGT